MPIPTPYPPRRGRRGLLQEIRQSRRGSHAEQNFLKAKTETTCSIQDRISRGPKTLILYQVVCSWTRKNLKGLTIINRNNDSVTILVYFSIMTACTSGPLTHYHYFFFLVITCFEWSFIAYAYHIIAFKSVSLPELWHERKAFQQDGVKFSALVAFAWLTLPICFLKQVISIIQLIVACINTAHLDESERERVNKWLAIEAEKPNGILPLWTHSDWCQ